MNDHDEDLIMIVTERFEHRLSEETGKLRVEMATGFGQLRAELALVRADGIERNNELLKWLLLFAVAQTAALAGIMALFK